MTKMQLMTGSEISTAVDGDVDLPVEALAKFVWMYANSEELMADRVVQKFDILTKDQRQKILQKVEERGQLPLETLQ